MRGKNYDPLYTVIIFGFLLYMVGILFKLNLPAQFLWGSIGFICVFFIATWFSRFTRLKKEVKETKLKSKKMLEEIMKNETLSSRSLSTSPVNWLKTLSFIVLGLIIIVSSIYVGVKIGSNQVIPQQPIVTQQTASSTQTPSSSTIRQTETPALNEATGWLIYSNTKFGVSFEHPSDYRVSFLDGSINLQKNSTRALLHMTKFENYNPDSLDILEWFNDQSEYDTRPIKDYSNMIETTVNGRKALKFIKIQPIEGYKDFLVVVGNKSNVYYLNFGPLDDEVDTANQILSTFKFTN